MNRVSWLLMACAVLSWAPSPLSVAEFPPPAWVASPPLAGRLPATLCQEVGVGEPRDIVFEWVSPGDLDEADIRELTAGPHEVVAFRWSESTGELRYDTTAPTAIFSDLAASSRADAEHRANCGSR